VRKLTTKNAIKILPFLLFLEGLSALLLLFRIPSEQESVTLLGFSLSRLLFGVGFGIVLILLLVLFLAMNLNAVWIQGIINRGEKYLSTREGLLFTILVLSSFILAGVAIIILFNSPVGRIFGPLSFVYERSSSILYWVTIACIQCLLVLFMKTHNIWHQVGFFDPSFIARYLVIFIIIVLVLLHWTIILLQLPIFSDIIKYWWMRYEPKEFICRDLWIICAFLAAIVIARCIMRFPKRWLIHLLSIIALGYLLQVGFGYIDGGGYEVLRQKLVGSNHNRYAINAVPDLSYIRAIRLYEERYADDRILSTKPPGSLIFYISMEKLANIGSDANDPQQRYLNLVDFVSYTFPLVATLCVPVIFLLGKRIISVKWSLFSSLIYVLTPSFLLIQLQLDQFLYPLIFTLGIYVFQIVISSRKMIFAFGMGVLLYLILFLSFSLIPIVAFLIAYLCIKLLFGELKNRRIDALRQLLFITLGFFLSHVLFRIYLDYDFLTRYVKAIEYHRMMKLFEPGLPQILSAMVQNNLEFAMWTGIPMIFLSLSRFLRSVIHLLKNNLSDVDFMVIAFVLMLIGLNLFGQTRGEVGHIWMFMLPMLSIFSIDEVKHLGKEKNWAVQFFIIAQLFTSYLIFKFQDFF
jgi:hypothetical protein